jgi:hypothetical protein
VSQESKSEESLLFSNYRYLVDEIFFLKRVGKFSYTELYLMPTDLRNQLLTRLIKDKEEEIKQIEKTQKGH